MSGDDFMQNVARNAQAMQQQAERVKERLRAMRAEGESGGGWVRVLLNGERRALRVEIADEAMQDKDMLQDLLASAFSEASRQVEMKLADVVREAMTANIADDADQKPDRD